MNGGMALQQLRDRHRRRAMPFHAQLQRFQAPQQEEGGDRRDCRTGKITQAVATDGLDQVL
jgi:hypothetical protein